MKRKLFLHIGRPKVGSTALQTLLHDNRELLARRGVLYPESPMLKKGSHKLALVFQRQLRDARTVESCSPSDVYDALHAEVERRGLPRVVVSTENMFLVDPSRVVPLLTARYDVTVVCYLRRQDRVLVSSLVQEIKEDQVAPNFDIDSYAQAPKRLEYLDYALILGRWAKAFGRANIVVRILEPSQLQGSLQEDFLRVLQVSAEGFSIPEARQNSSLARDALEFIRMINGTVDVGIMSKSQLHQFVLAASEQNGADGAFSPDALVPPRVRQALLDRFRDSNAVVAREYMGRSDGVLFEDTTLPTTGDEPYRGLDLHRFARMVASIVTKQQKQILRLQKRIHELERQRG